MHCINHYGQIEIVYARYTLKNVKLQTVNCKRYINHASIGQSDSSEGIRQGEVKSVVAALAFFNNISTFYEDLE